MNLQNIAFRGEEIIIDDSELSESAKEGCVMTVHGTAGVYHIAIIENETEQSWLMFGPPTEIRVQIGGNQFPMHQICQDGQLARAVILGFFETGTKFPKAEWVTLDLDA